jgi:DNA-binding Lrp family transcriptional regulator
MAVGFVLIRTTTGKEHSVYDRLHEIGGVSEVHPLFGEYDLIVKIDIDDHSKFDAMVKDVIKKIDGVTDIKTLTGIKF